MSVVFIILLCFLFLSGMVILLSSVGQYTSYAETEGEIIEALKCNPCDEEEALPGGKAKKSPEEAVVIAYQVEGRTYHLATNYKKSQAEIPSAKNIRILYNPYFPGESRIKEGNPFLGSILVASSLIGFVLWVFFL